MYCRKCGKTIPNHAKFCSKCGTTVVQKNVKKKKSHTTTVLVTSLVLFIGICGGIFVFHDDIMSFISGKRQNEEINSNNYSNGDADTIPPIDAEEYISSFGTIKELYNASENESMLSECEVVKLLSNRGFEECSIYTHYTRDGKYYSNTEISADSDVKHPNYDLQYITPNGNIWNIFIIKDTLSASPISFILSDESDCNIIYTESNLLFFYDNVTDKYYEVESNSNDIKVISNSEITANTLDNITIEEMKKS